jgi:lantibiotic biosynthesis protein
MAEGLSTAKPGPESEYLGPPDDLIMIRVPLLDIGTYRSTFAEPHATPESLFRLLTDPTFVEMLAVASPVLASRIDAFHRNPSSFSSKRINDLLRSVARYLIRATTRATPFGAFAGIAVGSIGSATVLQLDGRQADKKICRLDYQVVLRLVHDLERDPELRPYLHLFSNPALYPRGGRMLLAYRDSYGQGDPGDQISVRASQPLLFVLSRAQTPQPYSSLFNSLRELYPTTSEERLHSFLQSLLEQRILLSTLRPPLTEPDPLSYLQSTLSPEYQGPVRAELDLLRSALAEYNRTPLSQGRPILESLAHRVQSRFQLAPACVQVDTRLAVKEVTLPFRLADELSQAVLALVRLSPVSATSKSLRHYAHEFVERYGLRREIPVLELLDEEVGLGGPPT